MRSMQWQLGTWKPPQHLLKDTGKPRKQCPDGGSQNLADVAVRTKPEAHLNET
jgi:hypothetical protein